MPYIARASLPALDPAQHHARWAVASPLPHREHVVDALAAADCHSVIRNPRVRAFVEPDVNAGVDELLIEPVGRRRAVVEKHIQIGWSRELHDDLQIVHIAIVVECLHVFRAAQKRRQPRRRESVPLVWMIGIRDNRLPSR